jgi:uncharacterized protein YwgA
MKSLEKAAILLDVAGELRKRGSWCGETHLQKVVYFLEEMTDVSLDFDFVLYKHCPFSFELREQLAEMRADGLFGTEVKPAPYGPTLYPTDLGEAMRQRFLSTVDRYNKDIVAVTEQVGDKGVAELERLGTALYVMKCESEKDKGAEALAAKIGQLKPHIGHDEAIEALETVKAMQTTVADKIE